MGILCVTASTSYHRANYEVPLRRLCRDVEIFRYGPNMSATFWAADGQRLRAAANAAVRELSRKMSSDGRLNVVFLSAYDDFLERATLLLWRTLGAVVVNHMVDMPTQWFRILKSAPYFDCLAVAHHAHEERFRRVVADVVYLPMAADSATYRPSPDARPGAGPGVSFVGSFTPVRAYVLRPVSERFPDVEIYGKWTVDATYARALRRRTKALHDVLNYGKQRVAEERMRLPCRVLARAHDAVFRQKSTRCRSLSRGALSFQKMVDVFASTTINLGVTQSEGPVGMSCGPCWVRGRDFEIPMCGGFYLVQRAPEHDIHFRLGEEIETWSTVDELIEKIEHFRRYPERALEIAARGCARAQRDHTWAERYAFLFRHLRCENELVAEGAA